MSRWTPFADRLRSLWRASVQTARLVVGVPDYDLYVAHLRRRLDVREGALQVALVHAPLAGRADHARARAEAAVHGAAIGREQEDAIRIALHELRRDLVGFFAERVAEIARDLDRLLRAGHALEADRAARIVATWAL